MSLYDIFAENIAKDTHHDISPLPFVIYDNGK